MPSISTTLDFGHTQKVGAISSSLLPFGSVRAAGVSVSPSFVVAGLFVVSRFCTLFGLRLRISLLLVCVAGRCGTIASREQPSR